MCFAYFGYASVVAVVVVVCYFEVTKGSGSLGVHDAFWDSFAVEMGNVVDEGEVLEDDGAIGSCRGGGC